MYTHFFWQLVKRSLRNFQVDHVIWPDIWNEDRASIHPAFLILISVLYYISSCLFLFSKERFCLEDSWFKRSSLPATVAPSRRQRHILLQMPNFPDRGMDKILEIN
jgi:hypothetical protein